jgi:hypothetical protein
MRTKDFAIGKRGSWKIFYFMVSGGYKLLGIRIYPGGRNYGRKDPESANRGAPRDSGFPFGALFVWCPKT